MNTPDVKSLWRMGTKRFEGEIKGELSNSTEVKVRGKVNTISQAEREIADKYIKMDNSEDDMDPRTGFIALYNKIKVDSNAHMGFKSRGEEAVMVSYDTSTGYPKEMSRDIDLKDHYTWYDQIHHSTGHSKVQWDNSGEITFLEEERSGPCDREIVKFHKDEKGTIHYREK